MMKKVLPFLLLLCLVAMLGTCGKRKNSTGSPAPSASPQQSVSSSASQPGATYDPLLAQEVYGLRFELPASAVITRTDLEENSIVQYTPYDGDPDETHALITVAKLEELPAASTWSDEFFDVFIQNMLGDAGTLLLKGSYTVGREAPREGRYFQYETTIDGRIFSTEVVTVDNISVLWAYDEAYEAYASQPNALWENLLDSIEFLEPAAPSESAPTENDGIRPEFREMMDSYEAFFEEYAAFMEKYQRADTANAANMLTDLSNYMTKYADVMAKLQAVDQSELSPAEAVYYTEVNARIMKILAGVAAGM